MQLHLALTIRVARREQRISKMGENCHLRISELSAFHLTGACGQLRNDLRHIEMCPQNSTLQWVDLFLSSSCNNAFDIVA